MTSPNLEQLLARTRRSLMIADVVRCLLRAWAVVLLAFIAAVLIDAGYGLPGSGLLLLDAALLAALVYALIPLVGRLVHGPINKRHTAVYLEQHLGITDNRLINALDLADQDAPGSSAALCREAIQLGDDEAQAHTARSVIDTEPVRRTLKPAALATVALFVSYLLVPAVFHAVIPRMALPLADLPPYTRLHFEVAVNPEPVYVGKPATIRTTLTGPVLPAEAGIVFIDDGEKASPIPMTLVHDPAQNDPDAEPAHTFSVQLKRVDQPRRFYIATEKGRSSLYTLTPDTAPQFELASVRYDYPDYTRWPDTIGPLSRNGIRALEGTSVRLSVQSNVPLQNGVLRMTDPSSDESEHDKQYTLLPDPDDPRLAHVDFTLDRDGQFELSLVGIDDVPSNRTLQGECVALPDRAPKIEIAQPDRQAVVPEGWEVKAHVIAGDDFGLGDLSLHMGLNNAPTTEVPLTKTYRGASRTAASADYAFAADVFGAKAGDTIRYYAAVHDNHPGSPHAAESDIHALHIITMEQYMDLARSQYHVEELNREFEAILDRLGELASLREDLLEELTELQQRLDAGEALTENELERLAELEKQLTDYADQASALAEQLQERADQASLYDFEDAYKQMLSELANDLQAQADQAQSLADAADSLQAQDSPGSRDDFALEGAQFSLMDQPFDQATQAQTDQVEQDIEKLRLAEAMLAQGARIRQIAFEQDELAVRLSGLASLDPQSEQDSARAEALAEEQARLREALAEASQALREAAEDASEALPNMSSGAMAMADRIAELQILSTQSAAEKASLAGNGPLAHQAARDAADKLDSLLSDAPQGQAQAASGLDGCFNLPREQWQNALQQMAAGRGVPSMGSQGSSGVGMSGQMASMTMMGPSVPSQASSNSQSHAGRFGSGRGPGHRATADHNVTGFTDVIDADGTAHPADHVTLLPDVPAEYQEQAHAYFKRLAEEQ